MEGERLEGERRVWKPFAASGDDRLEHVGGNRAGRPGVRVSQVHNQQDLVAVRG